MTGIVDIEADVVEYMRTYVYTAFGNAAGDISGLAEDDCRDPEMFAEPRERYREATDLLDAIGWSAPSKPRDVAVDLAQCARLLSAAIDTARRVAEDDLGDLDEQERDGSASASAVQRKREETLGAIGKLDELKLALAAADG